MNNRLWVLGVIAAIAALAVVKSMEPRQASGGSCCPPLDVAAARSSAAVNAGPDLGRGMPTWVLAHSDMCQQCKEMSGISAKVVPEFKGKVRFIDLKVDSPEDQPLVKKLKVNLIPTSIFLDADGKEVERKVGLVPADDLRRKLAALAGDK